MVAGESVGVLHDPLFVHAHQDGLTTHGADAVREVFSGHSGCTVILSTKRDKSHDYTFNRTRVRDSDTRRHAL